MTMIAPPDAVTFETIIGALQQRSETEKAEKLRLVNDETRSDTLVPFWIYFSRVRNWIKYLYKIVCICLCIYACMYCVIVTG